MGRLGASKIGVALVIGVSLGLAGCGSGHRPAPKAKPSAVPLTLSVSPTAGSSRMPVTTEIGTTVGGGVVSAVMLTDSSGRQLGGTMRADGTAWVPSQELAFNARYSAIVTATAPGGRTVTRSTTFATMPDPAGSRIGTGLYFFDGQTYGVGMPVVVEFDSSIPDGQRANVERRLFVYSDPPQVGVWHWYGDRQVLYRPEHYWLPGTRLTVRAALGGLPVAGRYIDQDRGGTASIGRKQYFEISNTPKQMRVYVDDRLVHTYPVSLGRPSKPSYSGNLVIMSREYQTLFKTPDYTVEVNYAERITWDGQFIHSAPWSVGQQGHVNVSHGCVNVAPAAAAWIYHNVQIGDPVTVTGTGIHVPPGDGWTVWDMPWDRYVQGSALPHPELSAGQGGGAAKPAPEAGAATPGSQSGPPGGN